MALAAAKQRRIAKARQAYEAKVAKKERPRVFHAKPDEARRFIESTLKQIELFRDVSSEDLGRIVDAMEPTDTAVGEVVISQGAAGTHFYIVQSGTYEVLLKENGHVPVHAYAVGGFFGELAMLYDKPRAATIKCKSAGVLHRLDRGTFMEIVT